MIIASDGAKIFDQNTGDETKDIAFGDAADLQSLAVINKSTKNALYCA